MDRIDVDLGIPHTERAVFVRVHRERGVECGLRKR